MDERQFNDWLAGPPALTTAQKQRLDAALAGTDPAIAVAGELDVRGVAMSALCGRLAGAQRARQRLAAL